MSKKARIMLVGGGGIGTMSAFNLERGGLAEVTMALRSNYKIVSEKGYSINSMDHGKFEGWKPTEVLDHVPDVSKEGIEPFDYVLCCTKNVPDVPPTTVDILKPAVTPGHSVIVLVQNGLNIEKPLLAAFPDNICLSGISRMAANELSHGQILQDDPDRLDIGVFSNPNIESTKQEAAAQDFIKLYAASGKVICTFQEDVMFGRWKKLIYNACWNPICALTEMDTGRLRLASDPLDPYSLVNGALRPAMNEIRAAAKAAAGVDLPEQFVDDIINAEPIGIFCEPSMQQDTKKNRFIESENILGEALREGENAGVPMPAIKMLYGLCKAVQWRTKERQGLLDSKELAKERSG